MTADSTSHFRSMQGGLTPSFRTAVTSQSLTAVREDFSVTWPKPNEDTAGEFPSAFSLASCAGKGASIARHPPGGVVDGRRTVSGRDGKFLNSVPLSAIQCHGKRTSDRSGSQRPSINIATCTCDELARDGAFTTPGFPPAAQNRRRGPAFFEDDREPSLERELPATARAAPSARGAVRLHSATRFDQAHGSGSCGMQSLAPNRTMPRIAGSRRALPQRRYIPRKSPIRPLLHRLRAETRPGTRACSSSRSARPGPPGSTRPVRLPGT